DAVRAYDRALTAGEILDQYRMWNTTTQQVLACSPINATDSDSLIYIYDWRADNVSIAVLNMPFDMNSTTVSDYSTYANSGTAVNARWSNSCAPRFNSGGCYAFNGTSANVSVSHSSSLEPTQISAAVWVKFYNLTKPAPQTLLSKFDGGGYYLGLNSTAYCGGAGTLCAVINTSAGNYTARVNISNISMSANTWHHVAFTYDGETLKLYINGTLAASNETPSGSIAYAGTSPKACIGAEGNGGDCQGGYLNGTLDNLLLFNHSISDEGIKRIYEQFSMNQLQDGALGENVNYTCKINVIDGYTDTASANSSIATAVILPAKSIILFPINDTIVPRGKDSSNEDPMLWVGNNLTLQAKVVEQNNPNAPIPSAACEFYVNGTLAGTNTTIGSTGICQYTIMKNLMATGGYHNISVNITNLTAGYNTSGDNWRGNTSFWLAQYQTLLYETNTRNCGGLMCYAIGDAAVLNISTKRDGTAIDIHNITVKVFQSDGTYMGTQYYPGEI
ncbi:hypothetical protein COV61_02405, partial [Candidatus Micrarchaeota archaeon CG11_big_fil_rev_8_21_14_0_20_47_5]